MASATLTLSAIAPTGLKFTTLVDPNISDTPSVAFGQSPTVVTTDMVVFRKWATKDGVTTSYSVTISTNGLPTVFAMSDSSSLSFQYFFWDESTSAYGTTSTYSILEYGTSSSGGSAVSPLPVQDFFEWMYANGSVGGVMKRMKNYLNTEGYTGSTNSMLYRWLGSQGYTGALTSRIDQFERDYTDQHG